MKTSETPGLREALGLLVEPVQKKYQNTKHNLIKTREAVLEIG